jgi:nitrite transporter NirC
MYHADIGRIAEQSVTKAVYLQTRPMSYLILSALAGVYLGFAITLIFSVGAPYADEMAASQRLVMGSVFGLALGVVIFAGSELFTGNNATCTVAALDGAISWTMVGRIWTMSFVGNLLGSLGVAWMVAQSGVLSHPPQIELVLKTAAMKMSLSGWELFVRGVLCNWLVCLAVWMAGRMHSETAKLLVIFWCLLAFVGSGFEHSIANQSLLGLALFHPHLDTVSWSGFVWNQAWVVLGNVIGGSVFVGGAYWLAATPIHLRQAQSSATVVPAQSVRI